MTEAKARWAKLRLWLLADERKALRHVVAIKGSIMVGMIVATVAPAEYATAAGLVTNLVWLWRL